MKRLAAMFVSFLFLVAGASTASAGVEDEQVITISPQSGVSYQTRYSCAAGTMHTLVRSTSGIRVIVEQQLLFEGVDSLPGGNSIAGLPGFDLTILSKTSNLADSWAVLETLEGDEPLEAAGPTLTIDGAELDCPDYAAPTPSVFVPITPERVLDTRADTAVNYSGPRPGDEATVVIERSELPVLPADAVAVSATVTATEASTDGFVQLLPTGATPGGSSNVNPQFPGHTLANNAVSPLASGGVSVYTHRSSHLLVDINGYFVESPDAATAGRYQQLDETRRIVDTRPATAINHTSRIVKGGTSLTIPVAAFASLGDEPLGAVAINVTATETGDAGFLQSAATGSLVPGESSIVNPTRPGDTVAAMTIVPVSDDGEIDIYTHADSHVIVDVLGWYTNSDAAASTSGRFVPLEPERVLDTRMTEDPVNCCKTAAPEEDRRHDFFTGRIFPAARATVTVNKLDEAGARDLMINLTAVDATSAGFFQAGAADSFVNGASSTVNATAVGSTVANAAIVGLNETDGFGLPSAAFQVYTQNGGHIVADISGYFTK